jgi:heme/copper-type cytochrome/quinol oxidase subunit 2
MANLWWVMLAGASLILGLVVALLAIGFRSGRSSGDEKHHERRWIVGMGLVFPSVILLLLLAYGLWIGERLRPRDDDGLVRVYAEARQWEWTFAYDDLPDHRTANVLHVPAGRPIDVVITTKDVIHSFWVPRLAGKLDAIPGHVNVLRIEATEPGTYAGVSAEFSGTGYTGHSFQVVAHDAAGWRAFVEGGQ